MPISSSGLADGLPAFDDGRIRLIAPIEKGLLAWLNQIDVPTLGELILTNSLADGTFFTHYGPWIGKGVGPVDRKRDGGKPMKSMPILYAKLDSLSKGVRVEIPLHPANFTTESSWSGLSRQNRLFVVARVTKAALPTVAAQAYAVGHIHSMDRPTIPGMDPHGLLDNGMEAHIEQIGCFAGVVDQSFPSKAEVMRLHQIPESDVKQAFAEIIGEPFVPNDWGGERSDLVAHRLHLKGAPVVAAFAFKGPVVKRPLEVGDMGKNGDQIGRLFTEPVDLGVVQHCHRIESSVRETMRAFATRFNDLRPFCLIDGPDTVRILKMHGKLGYGA